MFTAANLQCSRAEGDDRQVATSAERRSSCGQRHTCKFDSRGSFMTSYIGSTYLSESCTNSASWCSAACMDKQLSDFCQPVSGVASRQHLRSASRRQHWSCRATCSAPTAEGHLPWPVRRCGTLCLTI